MKLPFSTRARPAGHGCVLDAAAVACMLVLMTPAHAQSLKVATSVGATDAALFAPFSGPYGIVTLPTDSSSIYGLAPGSQNVYSITSGAINPTESLSASYSSGVFTKFLTSKPSQQASASAAVDLSAGTIKLLSTSALIDTSVSFSPIATESGALVTYGDTVNLTQAGATNSTVTTVHFSLTTSGLMSSQTGGGVAVASSGIFMVGYDAAGDSISGSASITNTCSSGVCSASTANGLNSGSFIKAVLGEGVAAAGGTGLAGVDTIDVAVNFKGKSASFSFLVNEAAQTAGGSADFSHTAHIGLAVPGSAAWTSTSGLLLAQSVPEPPSLGLALAGLSIVAASLRRRCAER